jgi:drug/metabolite transporter (DMT)-like permease
VFGIGLAIPLLGERLEAFHLAGAALVGIGIWTSLRKRSEQEQVPPAEALEPR